MHGRTSNARIRDPVLQIQLQVSSAAHCTLKSVVTGGRTIPGQPKQVIVAETLVGSLCMRKWCLMESTTPPEVVPLVAMDHKSPPRGSGLLWMLHTHLGKVFSLVVVVKLTIVASFLALNQRSVCCTALICHFGSHDSTSGQCLVMQLALQQQHIQPSQTHLRISSILPSLSVQHHAQLQVSSSHLYQIWQHCFSGAVCTFGS
jgi:hypothetical protein